MSSSTRNARILVVEDEALLAEEIADRLERLGYELAGSEATAQGAIDRAQECLPDLILMDIRLGGELDGIHAADRIYRELDIPIVYLTWHSDRATIERATQTVPFGYLLKPLQEGDLLVAIEIALQRHAMGRRLRESEARYATILRSIGEGVIAADSQGQVTFMNEVAEMLTGWSADQAAGQAVDQIFLLSDIRRAHLPEHPIYVAMRKGAIIPILAPFDILGRAGRAIPIECSAAPLLDAAGKISGAVVAFRDVREKHAAQEVLKRTEERLQKSQRLEAIGRLAGGVAHDFNNMLTVILGCCELLESSLRGQAAESALLQEIVDAGRRASGLTERLMAFSRRRNCDPRAVELGSLVLGLERLLRRIAGQRVEVVFDLTDQPLQVSIDVNHFEQVLVNLAVNARDAMAEEGGKLTLRTRVHEAAPGVLPDSTPGPGPYAILEVEDTGHGMDEATRGRIFEPYFTTKPSHEGAGLGLPMVYGTVHELGGQILVESEPGRGSRFTLYLPLADRGSPSAEGPTDP